MGFDIKQNNLSEKAETGYEFEVKLPNGVSTDWFITVRGNLSPLVRKNSRDMATKLAMKEIQDRKRNKGEQPPDYEEMERQLTDIAAMRVITWRGLMSGDEVIEPTPENIKQILSSETWVREQVIDQGNDDSNFI